MTVPQYFSSMFENHVKYPILPQAYQSHVRLHVGILLFSCLTGKDLKFGADISGGRAISHSGGVCLRFFVLYTEISHQLETNR
jgi:hypothetical protein